MTPKTRLVPLGAAWALGALLYVGAMAQTTPSPIKAVIIVHPTNPVQSLAYKEASDLFMKRTKTWPDGTPVVPVDQPVNPVRRAFSLRVLGREADAISSYWLQQVYSGREARPEQMADDAAVLAFVRANPGAIGYISGAISSTGVKVVPIQGE